VGLPVHQASSTRRWPPLGRTELVNIRTNPDSIIFNMPQRLPRPEEIQVTGVGLTGVQHVILRHGSEFGSTAPPTAAAPRSFSPPRGGLRISLSGANRN